MNANLLQDVLARIARRTPEEILAHPNFIEARQQFLRAATLSMIGDQDPRLGRMINSIGRAALLSVVNGRYFQFDRTERATWPTVTLIKKHYLPLGFVRSRTLDEVLARFCLLNLVSMDPHPDDGRTRLVMPSAQMLEFDRHWLADQYAALAMLYSEHEPGLALRLGDIRYQRVLRHLVSHNRAETQNTLGKFGPLRDAIFRQDGLRILTAYLLKAGETGSNIVNLPYREVEQVSSTSRTHIRQLLQGLAQMGLVTLHRPGGRSVELSPTLIAFIDQFVATVLSNNEVGWKAARWLINHEPFYAQYVPPLAEPAMI